MIIFLIERVIRFLHNTCAAAIQAVALGTMSNDQLEKLTVLRYERQWESYAREVHVASGLFLWEREAIKLHFPAPGSRVLVMAAGAGREMIALAGGGFHVDGYDCSRPLVARGNEIIAKLGIEAQLEYTPPSSVPKTKRRYEAALVGWSGYMYIPGRERRIRFLRGLCGQLSPGAPVMVSFTEGSAGRRREWTARVGSALRSLRGAESVEPGDCFANGYQHHFVYDEIRREMEAAGLDLVYYGGGTCYGHAIGRVREVLSTKGNPGDA